MNKMTGIILIILGFIGVFSGLYIFSLPSKAEIKLKINTEMNHLVEGIIADGVLTINEKETVRKFAKEKSLSYNEIISDIENRLKLSEIEVETELIDQNKKNGDDFENYVVSKFNESYYDIKEWAGDKYVNGRYAETTTNPDLIFELKDWKKRFAVECKWRKYFYNNGIEFAKQEQFERYRKFEKENGIPVFVAIGIGGKGINPEQLYIIPLKEIENPFLSTNYLKKYRKDIYKDFFFDAIAEELR
jgi:hypothetical protein